MLRRAFGMGLGRLLCIPAAAALIAFAGTGVRRPPLVPTQTGTHTKELATGKILVARHSLLDPNFAQTVVLIFEHNDKGTAGLIINRQTKIPLSRLSKEMEGAKGRSDPLYQGGPVEPAAVLALVRSRAKPEEAKLVVEGVHIISTKAALEKTMATGAAPDTFRLYLGYAGWDAGQLAWELQMDAWDVLPATAGIVFDPHPETLWPRLAQEEELQVAFLHGTVGISKP